MQRGVKAGSGLAALCQDGLVTDPQVIPYLLTGLKAKPYPNSFIAWYSLRSIVLMTRRMRGELDGNLLGGMTDPKRQSEVVAWWEHWWKINQSEHPVYDAEFDNKVRSAFLSVEQTIEEKIKPAHPELSLFHALTNMPRVRPLMALAQIYEHQYEPYYYSELMLGSRSSGTNALVYALRREDLPWLEVACRFADPEIPNNWRSPKAHQPPLRLATLLTSVYSNHIAGTSTYVEVKVASPNPDLVKDLKKALSGVR